MDIKILHKALLKSWRRETSYTPQKWDALTPSSGQCSPTALIVQDYFGGSIVWAEVLLPDGEKVDHYFNIVEGKEIDLTRNQFPLNTPVHSGIPKRKDFSTTRDFMLSRKNTQKRYFLLKETVEINLKTS